MKIYKVISSENGFKDLEKTVSMMLKKGWECQGGIAFNHGYCYQAMTIEQLTPPPPTKQIEPEDKKKVTSFTQASQAVDKLT